jgi:hypothetical protein
LRRARLAAFEAAVIAPAFWTTSAGAWSTWSTRARPARTRALRPGAAWAWTASVSSRAVTTAGRWSPASIAAAARARSAIVAPWPVAGVAFVVRVAITRRAFFQPIGQEFQVEINGRIAHGLVRIVFHRKSKRTPNFTALFMRGNCELIVAKGVERL